MKSISLLIVDKSIKSYGVLVNAALVIGLTAGRELSDETFGGEVIDGEGAGHIYLTKIGHYIRKAGQNKLRTLRQEFAKVPEVLMIDYTEDAAPADYGDYSKSLASHSQEEIKYRAIYIYGPEEIISPRTKNLSRL